MLIKNGLVYLPEGRFEKADLRFGAQIEDLGSLPGEGLDAEGLYVVPGFLDIHTHGGAGRDFSDGGEGDLEALSGYYASRGVTSFLATTMTLPEPVLRRAAERVRDFSRRDGARCLGLNLEGPFLSRAKCGAQNPEYLHAPDADMLDRLQDASGGAVRLVTVAPEEPGALGFIRRASKLCAVSLGHTAADYDSAMAAFEAGAGHLTHLYNAMPPLLHRQPGVIGAALDSGATAEIICDGFHIHPASLRAAFRLFEGRFALISDSLRCAGMPEGECTLGGLPVMSSGGVARLRDGTLAGSAINVAEGVKNSVRYGLPLEKAVAAATSVPAAVIGLGGKTAALAPGLPADLALLDAELSVRRVFIGGREYTAEKRTS